MQSFYKLPASYLAITQYRMNNKDYYSGIQITYNDYKPTWKHIKPNDIKALIKLSTKINNLPKQHKELTKSNTYTYGTHKEITINNKLYLIQQERDYKTNKLLNETTKEITLTA